MECKMLILSTFGPVFKRNRNSKTEKQIFYKCTTALTYERLFRCFLYINMCIICKKFYKNITIAEQTKETTGKYLTIVHARMYYILKRKSICFLNAIKSSTPVNVCNL